MKKKIFALFVLISLCFGGAYGQPQAAAGVYSPDMSLEEMLESKLDQEALQSAARQIALLSQVNIEARWSNGLELRKTFCKGVLINEKRHVVTHASCLNVPYSSRGEFELLDVMLWFSDGFGLGGRALKVRVAGSFAYWDVSSYSIASPSARLLVSANSTVYGWPDVLNPADVSLMQFWFNKKDDWKIEELLPGNARFTLSYALRARQPGEPVFRNGRVVALNSRPDRECPGVYPFNRPAFEAFTMHNGGEILQKL